MAKVYMIGAMKGGAGKTVTVFNLAYSLQKKGKKVLAVDFDPTVSTVEPYNLLWGGRCGCGDR